ncbi:unnamed protein product [Onchocerca ochengi]|uniref:Uncharacterized protein n=1 Tax=Onchocerca ochengi TaxID=42157 RepID=A0A182E5A9_ONCOC|nr:unnamed protein product [Onchocerca ochengi]
MMNAKSARKAFEKSLISSQINFETGERNGQSHPMRRNISRLPHIPTVDNTSIQRSESANEIETMNNLLTAMQKESDKRNEMLNSVFDKNFDGKIKTCIDARAKMEARAVAFEKTIQSETLIKKPIKNITIENTYEEVFGTNISQTGSTSDKIIMSPMEQQQVTLKYIAGGNSISQQSTRIAGDVISPNKVENKQISTEDAEIADKKVTKGFGEAALTKVGHWSKKAFKFLRKKSASSGNDATISRKNSRKKLHAEKHRSRHHVRDVKMKGIPQENFRRTRSSRKVKSRNHRKAKSERPKKTLRRSVKKRESEKAKFVPKMSAPTELGNTSNALKKHAAKLTEAKKRLKERTSMEFEKKKLNPEKIHESASHRGLVIDKKGTKKNVGKSKKSSKKGTKKTVRKSRKSNRKIKIKSGKKRKGTVAGKTEKFRE